MWDHDKKTCSVIGEDLVVDGDITSKSDLMIEGRVDGNVTCVSLYVGKAGRVLGDILSEDALIEGTVNGMVKSGSVELKDGCMLEGDITSRTLAIDHGAIFTGAVRPTREKTPPVKRDLTEAAE